MLSDILLSVVAVPGMTCSPRTRQETGSDTTHTPLVGQPPISRGNEFPVFQERPLCTKCKTIAEGYGSNYRL